MAYDPAKIPGTPVGLPVFVLSNTGSVPDFASDSGAVTMAEEITDIEHEAEEAVAEDAVSEEDAVVVDETQDSAEEFTDEVEAFEEDSEGHAGEARIIEPHQVVVSTGEKILLTEQEAIIGREDPISSIFPDIAPRRNQSGVRQSHPAYSVWSGSC